MDSAGSPSDARREGARKLRGRLRGGKGRSPRTCGNEGAPRLPAKAPESPAADRRHLPRCCARACVRPASDPRLGASLGASLGCRLGGGPAAAPSRISSPRAWLLARSAHRPGHAFLEPVLQGATNSRGRAWRDSNGLHALRAFSPSRPARLGRQDPADAPRARTRLASAGRASRSLPAADATHRALLRRRTASVQRTPNPRLRDEACERLEAPERRAPCR